ncbi:YcaO-like family protein [Rhodobacter calidifons]|uniref:YcaO-like family protein n=1 Tax=Rhodobacter calidifons TaxID=2715277 RepID=A0ABX0G659_9RHOB|nr:YcaO-like family protein [Rhodobacter calidifons]NHB76763.1 YcaO-like family protein [Rhodobacter calidifons]
MKQNPAELIAKLARALDDDFRILALDEPDAPLFLAVALPTDDGVTGLKPRLPAGRGMTPQQAMLAAGAEALELRASLAQRHLSDLRRLPRRDGIAMVATSDLVSGATVEVPAQEVYLDCAAILGEPLREDANSTGCAVGPDRDSALARGLWECVERDALALWWHGRLPGGRVETEIIDAHQPRLYWWLHQRARQTRLIEITSDIGLPVVVAASADPDGRTVAMGAAARPVLEDAALAAVTEMVQTEVSLEHAREAGDPEAAAWLAAASLIGQPQFQPGPERPARPMEMPALLERLDRLGHRALGIDMTLPGDPLPAVRVLVPGLCAMRGRIDCPRYARLCPDQPRPTLPEPF